MEDEMAGETLGYGELAHVAASIAAAAIGNTSIHGPKECAEIFFDVYDALIAANQSRREDLRTAAQS